MSVSFDKHIKVSLIFLICYMAGLIGWFWDWGEHMGTLQLGLTSVPAHLLMNVSIAVMFGTIVLKGIFEKNVRWFSYAGILVGALLFFIQPGVGVPILFIIPLILFWVYIKNNNFHLGTVFLLLGLGMVFVGVVIDWFWHRAYPDNGEAHNMLLVIGHQVQLAGWIIGLLSALVVFFKYRNNYVKNL